MPTEAPRKRPRLSALAPIVPYARRHLGRIGLALVALIVASLATLVVPWAIREMVDHGFHGGRAGTVHLYFGLLIGVVAVLALASGSRYYLVMTFGERIVADLRGDFFRHLTTLDQSFFDAEKTGEIISRLSADTTQLKATFGSSASIALRNIFMFVGAISLMIATSPKLSSYVLIAIPLIVLPLYAAGRSVRERSRRAQETLAEATAFASENLDARPRHAGLRRRGFHRAALQAAADGAYEAARHMTKARAVVTAIALFLAFSSVVVVLWLGAHDVIEKRMTAGVLCSSCSTPCSARARSASCPRSGTRCARRPAPPRASANSWPSRPTIVAPPAPAALPASVRGALGFERVTFAYPTPAAGPCAGWRRLRGRARRDGRHRRPLRRRQIDAIPAFGAFYDPSAGSCARRDRHLDVGPEGAAPAASRSCRRSRSFSARASPTTSPTAGRALARAEIEEAAARAAAHAFIAALPQGYDTQIGEHGVTLSGGERQRLAIARAILKDAPVLLLDEATSALDAENETLVQAALAELMKGRTTLVIAHRLATIVGASRILVLEAGEIVEQGNHATLLAAGGLYARLARLQFETGAAALKGAQAAE